MQKKPNTIHVVQSTLRWEFWEFG